MYGDFTHPHPWKLLLIVTSKDKILGTPTMVMPQIIQNFRVR